MWRGGAYEDFRYDGFAQGEITRLEEARLVCLENRITGAVPIKDHNHRTAPMQVHTHVTCHQRASSSRL
jgi:hypothetical protein